mmetsp:Transcript_24327/g.96473  ORF Transcript_24327/g.96473 Transcript_24327/m.96473 type:complete len:211 (+) Transcript_24327:213-845(+)
MKAADHDEDDAAEAVPPPEGGGGAAGCCSVVDCIDEEAAEAAAARTSPKTVWSPDRELGFIMTRFIPAALHSCRTSVSVCAVKPTTVSAGNLSRSRRVASMPLSTGMQRSMMTTSNWAADSTTSNACWPFSANVTRTSGLRRRRWSPKTKRFVCMSSATSTDRRPGTAASPPGAGPPPSGRWRPAGGVGAPPGEGPAVVAAADDDEAGGA